MAHLCSSMLGHQQLSSVPGLEYEKNVFGATVSGYQRSELTRVPGSGEDDRSLQITDRPGKRGAVDAKDSRSRCENLF